MSISTMDYDAEAYVGRLIFEGEIGGSCLCAFPRRIIQAPAFGNIVISGELPGIEKLAKTLGGLSGPITSRASE